MLAMSRRCCSNFTWICEVKIVIEIQCKHILSCPVSLSIIMLPPTMIFAIVMVIANDIISASDPVSHYFGIVTTFPLC